MAAYDNAQTPACHFLTAALKRRSAQPEKMPFDCSQRGGLATPSTITLAARSAQQAEGSRLCL
jgi:hypothetical protein